MAATLPPAIDDAVVTADVRKVRAWIRDGGDVNCLSGDGVDDCFDPPLIHLATLCGQLKIIKLLLDAGADPNQPSNWYGTPLNVACLKDKGSFTAESSSAYLYEALDVARLLLDYGADVDGMSRFDEEACAFSPLMRCAYAGYTEPLKLLLSRGANVDLKSDNGLTAEMLASVELHPHEVRSLAARTIPPELRPYGDKAMPRMPKIEHLFMPRQL